MKPELIAPETPYIYWYAGMRYVVYLVILRLASLLLSGLIDLKLYVSELRGTLYALSILRHWQSTYLEIKRENHEDGL